MITISYIYDKITKNMHSCNIKIGTTFTGYIQYDIRELFLATYNAAKPGSNYPLIVSLTNPHRNWDTEQIVQDFKKVDIDIEIKTRTE